jgi:hypothetical protein
MMRDVVVYSRMSDADRATQTARDAEPPKSIRPWRSPPASSSEIDRSESLANTLRRQLQLREEGGEPFVRFLLARPPVHGVSAAERWAAHSPEDTRSRGPDGVVRYLTMRSLLRALSPVVRSRCSVRVAHIGDSTDLDAVAQVVSHDGVALARVAAPLPGT